MSAIFLIFLQTSTIVCNDGGVIYIIHNIEFSGVQLLVYSVNRRGLNTYPWGAEHLSRGDATASLNCLGSVCESDI